MQTVRSPSLHFPVKLWPHILHIGEREGGIRDKREVMGGWWVIGGGSLGSSAGLRALSSASKLFPKMKVCCMAAYLSPQTPH